MTAVRDDAATFLRGLSPQSIDLLLTSPPYWCQRRYGSDPLEIGTESSVFTYVQRLCDTLHLAWDAIRPSGWMAVVIGDTYASRPGRSQQPVRRAISARVQESVRSLPRRSLAGLPPKTMVAVPERIKIGMIDRGWRCRNTVVWQKTNAMPTSVTDRLRVTHEVVHLFARGHRSYFDRDADALGRGDVWAIPVRSGGAAVAHPAAMPDRLASALIGMLCPVGGTVVDPFAGAGSTMMAASRLGRIGVGCDLYGWTA